MALVAPAFVVARAGQDVVVSVSVPADTSGWALTAVLRDQLGPAGTVVAAKTVGAGITNTPGATTSTVAVTFSAADLAGKTPGAYVWCLTRTNAGNVFDVVDWSTFLITPADSSAYPQLTNLSELAAAMGFAESAISDADAKAYLQLLAAAETAIRDLCGRQFNYATHTAVLDTDWRREVWLPEFPVNPAGIQVYFDRSRTFDSPTLLTYGTDYILADLDPATGWSKSGTLVRLNGVWEGEWERPYGMMAARPVTGRGLLKATFAAGFPLIPHPIRLACWQVVADRLSARGTGTPLQSESGMSYSYSRAAWADEAQKLLSVQAVIANYKRGDSYVG